MRARIIAAMDKRRMPSRFVPSALLACALLSVAAAGPVARADKHKHDHVEARELLRRGEILPLAAILQVAAKHVPGDVIEVELEHEDGGWEYDVKVLTPAGQLRKLTLDARHGKVLKIKDD